MLDTVTKWKDIGNKKLTAGNLGEAEGMYRSVLESDPNNATANHNLGVIELSKSSSESAIPHFRNAVESRPEVTQYWLSYIEALTLNMGANVRCVRKAIDDARKHGADERQLQSAEEKDKCTI